MSKLFSIGLEVEEVAVGRVLRQLDGMTGVAKINLNLTGQRRGEITDEAEAEPVRALAAPVQARGGNQPRRHNTSDPRGRMDQALADALKDSELHNKQIGVFLQRRGFSLSSMASQLNRMSEDRYIERGAGPGYWRLTPAGRKQFFGEQRNPSPTPGRSNARSGINQRGTNWRDRPADNSEGVRRLVLDALREGSKTTAELTKTLVINGKSSKNMSGTVYKMKVDTPALIVNRNGVYSLTPHGEQEIARIIEAEQSKQSPQPQPQAAE